MCSWYVYFLLRSPEQIPVQSYRCYVIWGSRWIVLIVPGILILANCGELSQRCAKLLAHEIIVVGSLGTVSRYFFLDKLPFSDLKAPFALAGATNLILMCLTGLLSSYAGECLESCTLSSGADMVYEPRSTQCQPVRLA
jgi:hypothetical protein